MKRLSPLALTIATPLLLSQEVKKEAEPEWISLFDGESLANWVDHQGKAVKEGKWTAENGVLSIPREIAPQSWMMPSSPTVFCFLKQSHIVFFFVRNMRPRSRQWLRLSCDCCETCCRLGMPPSTTWPVCPIPSCRFVVWDVRSTCVKRLYNFKP